MLLSSSAKSFPAMLGRFFVLALTAANLVLAQELTFTWPRYPEAYVESTLSWDGGTPPFTVYVLTSDLSEYYYKYVGSDYSTVYDFSLSAGTDVAFQCRDSGDLVVTSPTITVLETLSINGPSYPENGVSSVIEWSGGVSPYTVYVLSSDRAYQYWTYTGYEKSQYWTPDMDSGIEIVYQVIDYNEVTSTSDPVTVQGGSSITTTQVRSTTSSAKPSQTSGDTNSSGEGGGGKGINVSAIAGGAAGGVFGLVLLGALILLAKQGGARHQGGDIEDSGEGQGEKPGASAGVGGGGETRGIGEGVSPFPPGDAYAGGGGSNPAYVGSADAPGAAAYYQGQEQIQGYGGYPTAALGVEGDRALAPGTTLPQSVSYTPQVASSFATASALIPGQPYFPNYGSGSGSGSGLVSPSPSDSRMSPPSDRTGGGTESSLLYSQSTSNGPDADNGGGGPNSPGPGQFIGSPDMPGWTGFPEIQS